MINVTSQYPTQLFLAAGITNIMSQVNSNNSGVPTFIFPKKYKRLSSAQTAPDGSGAAMYQIDALIGSSAFYACQSISEAQRLTQEAAAYLGNEYYIEAPITGSSYSILTWASNI